MHPVNFPPRAADKSLMGARRGSMCEPGARRPRVVGLAGVVTLGAFAAATGALATAPAHAPELTLGVQAVQIAARLEDEVAAALALAAPLRARLRSAEPPDWKAFDTAVAGSPARRPAQQLVAWVPRVPAGGRAAFEAESGRDAFRTYRIVEPGRGVMAAAPARAHHHPIAFTAPLQPGAELLGFDLEAVPELEAALRATEPTVAGPLSLLPAASCANPARTGCAPQIIVVLPVAPGRGRPPGTLLVALSWQAITRGTLVATGLDLLAPRRARAAFRVGDRSFTIDLRLPLSGGLTARLGRARLVTP